jgi:uncharacterized membrane protein
MTLGPVQLLVLGFNQPDFKGEVLTEFERLAASDTVKVIDSLVVIKDADGDVGVARLSNLSTEEALEVGATIGALIGLGFAGEEGMEAGALVGAEAAAAGATLLPDAAASDVLEAIPNDSAAALILIEHRWAVPLRDAVLRAGGFRVSDGFIGPLDLVEIGLLSAVEAKELHDFETAATGGT